MNEHQEQEKTLVIDIRITRGLVAVLIVALLAVACVGYLALGQQAVSANSSSAAPEVLATGSSGLRQYYMTRQNYNGANAATACAAGYHMASLWEILDTSNLEYNTDLGFLADDSGAGPVSGHAGWVRTGYNNSVSAPAGQANCNGWSSSDSNEYGTMVGLISDWGQAADIGTWGVLVSVCQNAHGVWCVED